MADKSTNAERRNFLKLAGLAAPAAAVAAVAAPKPAAAAAPAPQGKGLRKTAHVQAYLDSARF